MNNTLLASERARDLPEHLEMGSGTPDPGGDATPVRHLQILVLAIVVLIGLLHLSQPFYDDPAFFTIGAQGISKGEILYRDFWDIKQPGIFAFYLAGGKVFGFDEVGEHAFELLYLIGLSLVLMRTMKKYYRPRWVAAVCPLLTVGVYYGVSGIHHLGQVEGLVGFPMFLCLWFAYSSTEPGKARMVPLFLSGIMGGFVLLLKLIFLPIVAAFWLTTIVYVLKKEPQRRLAQAVRYLAAVSGGLLIPLFIVAVYFARVGALGIMLYTCFSYPVRAVATLPHLGPGHLLSGLEWFVSHFAPLLGLGFVGAAASLSRRKDLLTFYLAVWFVFGAAVILVQRVSWHQYHYMLLCVPAGLLAAKGIEVLWQELKEPEPGTTWYRQRNHVLVLGLVLLFSPLIGSLLIKSFVLARYHFAIHKQERLAYQSDRYLYPDSFYPSTLAETEFLSHGDALPGDIAVVGNPMFYLLSGRHPATGYNAGFENFLPEQWKAFAEELAKSPPPYIFIANSQDYRELVEKASPQTVELIRRRYAVLHTSDAGTWYRLLPGSPEV